MRRRRLSRIVAAHGVGFALALSAVLITGTVLLLYILEDSFIDRRLREVATQVSDLAQPPRLPPRFSLPQPGSASAALRIRTAALRHGAIAEFRLHDGRYVHVLRLRDMHGRDALLVYDVTDQLIVNDALRRTAPWLAAMLAAIAVLAWAWSSALLRRIARQAERMLELIRRAPDPDTLDKQALAQPVIELGEFGQLLADAWRQRLAAVQREQETLAFLAHELRTPLQSARTSLALLHNAHDAPIVVARLRRAIDRLVRASNSVLWLASDADVGCEHTDVAALLDELQQQFAPLAGTRGQALQVEVDAAARWPGPRDVLEAVLGNLLLNAIQHGDRGTITLQCRVDAMVLRNPAAARLPSPGFGLGLALVDRLCARCGWRCLQQVDEGVCEFRIIRDASPRDPTAADT